MSRTANLMQRKGRWYFNKAYPKDLWGTLGRASFRVSLQTDSLTIALRLRPDAERRYFAIVDEARGQKASLTPARFTEFDAITVVSQWFRDEVARQTQNIEELQGSRYVIDEALEQINEQEIDAQQALSEFDVSTVSPIARKLLEDRGFQLEWGTSAFQKLLRLLLRGQRELHGLGRARLLGDYRAQPEDPEFLKAYADIGKAPSKTLRDLIEAHQKDKVASLSPSTQSAYLSVWRLMRDVMGDNRDLSTIRREDGRALFEAVQRLPRGLGKLRVLSGLSVQDAIKKAELLGLPTIAPKTINGSYMGYISSIFGWAVREQWMTANPVERLSVIDSVAEADKRDPFTPEQLQKLFKVSPWFPRDEQPRGKALHFWGPLIALYLGMRRGEIAQLDVADVSKSEEWDVILVRHGGRKRLKTDNARRVIPIHPELIRFGFLRYVESRRKSGEIKLFSGEVENVRGQWGDGFSDWFIRLLSKHDITGTRLGMHSFRHNWQDRQREAGLHGTAIGAELAGRSKGGDASNNYGSGSSTKSLAEAVAKINYPELDLSHLRVD